MHNQKTFVIAIIGIISLFAVGLVGYFIFSEPYGDGLEMTIEQAELTESEPVYHAPLDYGDNYPLALSMGCIGLAASFLCLYLFSYFLKRKRASRDN